MSRFILSGAEIINEGRRFIGYVEVADGIIRQVAEGEYPGDCADVRDLRGKWLMPGVIDTHVHFREPGMTRKADIRSESRAAAAGGVTAYFDMPNCVPPTVTADALADKQNRAAQDSLINYAFYIGAAAGNYRTLADADYSRIPGVKVFLGASTGNMQVEGDDYLDEVFSLPQIISVHSEQQRIIAAAAEEAAAKYGKGNVPVSEHWRIRSREACEQCTAEAVERAKRLGTHLHVLHISTADELKFFEADRRLEQKQFTAEACVQHLWFNSDDYSRLGSRIKCNPAIKTEADRQALIKGVADGLIDVVSTDHAPHLPADKEGDALTAASGIPLIQYSLPAMLELAAQGCFPVERVVEVMAHNPARLFGIEGRGFIREGYAADLTVVDPTAGFTVEPADIRSKCGWSPFEGLRFSASVAQTFVNGVSVFPEEPAESPAKPLTFNH